MPAKGTRKIPKKEKAQIIAEKRMKTAMEVAAMHGISPSTVYTVQYNATPEILAMAEEYHKHVTKQGQLNVLAGLQNMHGKMADPDTPLKELTPAVKVNHDIVQIQTGQPTNINANYELSYKRIDIWVERFREPKIIDGKVYEPSLDMALDQLVEAEIVDVSDEVKREYIERARRLNKRA